MAPISPCFCASCCFAAFIHRDTRRRQCGPDARRGRQAGRREISRGARHRRRRQRAEDRGRQRRGWTTAPATQEIAQGAIKAVLSYTEEKSARTSEISRARRSSPCSPAARRSPSSKARVRASPIRRSACRSPRSTAQSLPGSRGVVLHRRGALLLRHERRHGKPRRLELDHGRCSASSTAARCSRPIVNGDGRYEFMTRDNAFLYAFACYACSEAPLKLLAIENGARQGRDAPTRASSRAHAAWLKTMIDERAGGSDVNGFLAGYVGEKILLGEGKSAWELMLAHYDKASDWGLEILRPAARRRRRVPGRDSSGSPSPKRSNACLRKTVIR